MEERNIKITLEKAKDWYKSGDNSLKEVALQAFTEKELKNFNCCSIKTFDDAYNYLFNNNMCEDLLSEYHYTLDDTYSEKICKYRIIVAALTNNEERHLTTGERWYPIIQFCKPGKEKNCYGSEIIGSIESEGQKFTVVGGYAHYGSNAGLSDFYSLHAVSGSWHIVSFQSVSSKEIAQYISKQFGRLLFEVHYGGVNCDWKWID